MRDLVGVIHSKAFHEIVDQAVREAVRLQVHANKEYDRQRLLEESGEDFNYLMKAGLEEGARALCQVLWRVFGGCPADSIEAIRKITRENKSDIPGYDSQDYVDLFMEAFEEGRQIKWKS